MINKKNFTLLLCKFLILFSISDCMANSYGPFEIITPTEKSEFWLTPGLLSYHFDQSQDFNGFNYGVGGEYKFSSVASLTVGTFRNSHYEQSNYLGAYWQPIAIGRANIGLVAGFFNGYQSNNNGGWFPAALPTVTIEGERFGLNIIIIPTIGNRVSGSLSFQLKFKVFN